MDDKLLYRLGLTAQPHIIEVLSIARREDNGRDVSKLKFCGWFQPEQIEDADLLNALYHEPEGTPGQQLTISAEPLFAVDAKSLAFDIASGATRLRLARPLGAPLELLPATVKLKQAVICPNKELDRPPVALIFEAEGIPSEQLFSKVCLGRGLGIAFEQKEVAENTADDPEPVEAASAPLKDKKHRGRKGAPPVAEASPALTNTIEANRLNSAGLDSLPLGIVIQFQGKPDAEGQVRPAIYSKQEPKGNAYWLTAEGSLASSYYLLSSHFHQDFAVRELPKGAGKKLPEWVKPALQKAGK